MMLIHISYPNSIINQNSQPNDSKPISSIVFEYVSPPGVDRRYRQSFSVSVSENPFTGAISRR